MVDQKINVATSENSENDETFYVGVSNYLYGPFKCLLRILWKNYVMLQREMSWDVLWSPYVIGQTIIFLPCD